MCWLDPGPAGTPGGRGEGPVVLETKGNEQWEGRGLLH